MGSPAAISPTAQASSSPARSRVPSQCGCTRYVGATVCAYANSARVVNREADALRRLSGIISHHARDIVRAVESSNRSAGSDRLWRVSCGDLRGTDLDTVQPTAWFRITTHGR